jgi:hypothetical protein
MKELRSIFILFFLLLLSFSIKAQSRIGPNDTILVQFIVYEGDTLPYAQLDRVLVIGHMSRAQRNASRKWTRLRNAVYVTYPYAKKAAAIINDVTLNLNKIKDEGERRRYLTTREKELKKEFTEPLTNLSVYQGKILMKLINRETNNTCYELIKEYRGGFSARFWQTLAWFFGSSLKQEYLPYSDDAEMEVIVHEVARMYGHSS